MSEKPNNNMEQRINPGEQGASGPPAKDRRKELKKRARGAGSRAETTGGQARKADIEAEKESLKQEILTAPDFDASVEIFETLNEGRLTPDEFAEMMIYNTPSITKASDVRKSLEAKGFPVSQDKLLEILRKKQREREAAAAETQKEATPEAQTKEERGPNAGAEDIYLEETPETQEASENVMKSTEPQPEKTREGEGAAAQSAEEVEAPPEQAESDAAKPSDSESIARTAKLSRFLAHINESSARVGTAHGERDKEGKGTGRGRTRKARRPGKEGEEELSVYEESSEESDDGFRPSPDLEQKFMDSDIARAEAEAFWESVRNEPWNEATLACLEVVAKKVAISEKKFREAKETEMEERRLLKEKRNGSQRAAPRGWRWGEKSGNEASVQEVERYMRTKPPKATIFDILKNKYYPARKSADVAAEEVLRGEKQEKRPDAKNHLKLLKNIRGFINSLRIDRGQPEGKRRYSQEENENKMGAVSRIFQSEDASRALADALESGSLNQEEYDRISGPSASSAGERKSAAEEKISAYSGILEDRWLMNDGIENDTDLEKLQAAARRIFSSANPSKEAEKAVESKKISEEEKDKMMAYIGANKAERRTAVIKEKEEEVKNPQIRMALKKLDTFHETPEKLALFSITLLDLAGSNDIGKDLKKMKDGSFKKRGLDGEETVKISKDDYDKLSELLTEADKE